MNNASYSQEPEGKISSADLKEDLSVAQKVPAQATLSKSPAAKSHVDRLFATEESLRIRKKQPVVFSPPLITRISAPVIFRHTINVIQGQTGVHKSRLGSHLASLLIRESNCAINLLDFEMRLDDPNLVVYVDTERNQREQLPYAIQEILKNAGYSIEDDPALFRYTSLLDTSRTERFQALNDYLAALRQSEEHHMVIFLDVLTDCVEDFNRADKSLELIDFLNRMINEHDCTFICLIHENPGQGKARGHLGTELINKASTVIQIAFEKQANMEDSNILKIKFLKCRGSAKLPTFYAMYSEEAKLLIAVDDSEVKNLQKSRQTSAVEDDVVEALEELFQNRTTIPASEIISKLKERFGSSEKTILRRLKDLLENQTSIYIRNQAWVLSKAKEGKSAIYSIVPPEAADE